MTDELDLEHGDPAAASDESTRETRRRRRRTTSKDDTPSDGLRGRLQTAFDKIAEQMDVRGDEELAVALREEAGAMAQGFDSLTQTLKPLRYPLLVLVALIEPVLAFWRVGGILFRRFMARRQRRWEEAQAAAEAEGNQYEPAFSGGTVIP